MKPHPLIVFRREFDGTGLLFNPDNGKIFGLNPTAALIWQALEQGQSETEILTMLGEKLNMLPESAADDLTKFLNTLCQKGVLV